MSLPLKLDFSDYDNFLTEPNYTTSAEAQDYFRNMDMLVEALIDVGLWQPETNYPNGHVVFSPNMPNGTEAVCVATNGGKSSNTEPSWGEVGGDNVSDGTCFWKLRWKHWSKDIATQAQAEAGTDNTTVMTPLRTKQLGDKNYLPLSGGKMTGPIRTNGFLCLGGTDVDRTEAYLRLVGGEDGAQAAGLWLGDNLHSSLKGCFALQTGRDENGISYRLEGLVNGKLVWNDLELAQKTKLSMPSGNFIDIDVSVRNYTAPADGWLTAKFKTTTDNVTWIDINNATSGLYANHLTHQNAATLCLIMPCKKGDNLILNVVNDRGTMELIRFIYAQSEV